MLMRMLLLTEIIMLLLGLDDWLCVGDALLTFPGDGGMLC